MSSLFMVGAGAALRSLTLSLSLTRNCFLERWISPVYVSTLAARPQHLFWIALQTSGLVFPTITETSNSYADKESKIISASFIANWRQRAPCPLERTRRGLTPTQERQSLAQGVRPPERGGLDALIGFTLQPPVFDIFVGFSEGTTNMVLLYAKAAARRPGTIVYNKICNNCTIIVTCTYTFANV